MNETNRQLRPKATLLFFQTYFVDEILGHICLLIRRFLDPNLAIVERRLGELNARDTDC